MGENKTLKIVNIGVAREKFRRQKLFPESLEQSEIAAAFTVEKREFIEAMLSSLVELREIMEKQISKLQIQWENFDEIEIGLGISNQEQRNKHRFLVVENYTDIKNGFNEMQRMLVGIVEVNTTEHFAKIRSLFEKGVEKVKAAIDERSEILGEMPYTQLDLLPEAKKEKVLRMQKTASPLRNIFLSILKQFTERLNLMKGWVDHASLEKVDNATESIKLSLLVLQAVPLLKILENQVLFNHAVLNIEERLRVLEEEIRNSQ